MTDETKSETEQEVTEIEVEVVTPIVIDLGKTRRKQIKRLKAGQGKLADEIVDVLDEVIEGLGEELAGKALVPIVMVYEKKPKKYKGRRVTLPF